MDPFGWLDTCWSHDLPDDGVADRVRAWAKDGWLLQEHDDVLHAVSRIGLLQNPSHAVVTLHRTDGQTHVTCLVTTWAFGFGQDDVHKERCKTLDAAVTASEP